MKARTNPEKRGPELTVGTLEEMELSYLIDRCGVCGWALALAHAKAGDPPMIAGYVGKGEALDEAIARFGVAYGDQTERDHGALLKALPKSARD